MIKIVGAKGKITNVDDFLKKIKKFSEKNNIGIQTFNADLIFGKLHLISAYEHAKRAVSSKTNTTNSLEMEILLYASGERQLKNAIPKIGVKKGESKVAFLFLEKIDEKNLDNLFKELNLKIDDNVLDGDINTLKKFGITVNEINTISKDKFEDLILEKIALVDILK
jgi:KEOPS complex subunit Cgi121